MLPIGPLVHRYYNLAAILVTTKTCNHIQPSSTRTGDDVLVWYTSPISTNPIQHQRTKHVEIDLHFVRECVAVGDICTLHILTTSQLADIIKGLPTVLSESRSNPNIYHGYSFDYRGDMYLCMGCINNGLWASCVA
jgi:hypothetical protein